MATIICEIKTKLWLPTQKADEQTFSSQNEMKQRGYLLAQITKVWKRTSCRRDLTRRFSHVFGINYEVNHTKQTQKIEW